MRGASPRIGEVARAQHGVITLHQPMHSRNRFEADRRRDQRARRAGLDTLRFTRRQVVRDPGWVAATAVAMLAR